MIRLIVNDLEVGGILGWALPEEYKCSDVSPEHGEQ